MSPPCMKRIDRRERIGVMIEINEDNFDSILKKGKFLLMFYTDWCPRCPPIIEILKELEVEESGKFQFARINFDENPNAREYFHIPGVPVTMLINDSVVLDVFGGFTDKYAYQKMVNELLNEHAPKPDKPTNN